MMFMYKLNMRITKVSWSKATIFRVIGDNVDYYKKSTIIHVNSTIN